MVEAGTGNVMEDGLGAAHRLHTAQAAMGVPIIAPEYREILYLLRFLP